MKKPMFDRACNVAHGILESRMVARKEGLGRTLTDEETINELVYVKETIPYAGLEDDEKPMMRAINYLLRTAP